jgi:hypothetical protein
MTVTPSGLITVNGSAIANITTTSTHMNPNRPNDFMTVIQPPPPLPNNPPSLLSDRLAEHAAVARLHTVSDYYMPLILCALRRSGVTSIGTDLEGWGSIDYWTSRMSRFLSFADALRAACAQLSSANAQRFYNAMGMQTNHLLRFTSDLICVRRSQSWLPLL